MKQHLVTILRFFDLDHPVKAALFAAEILPAVGLIYAIVGRRPTVAFETETRKYRYFWEKLSWLDRLIYVGGEFYFSGHLMRGMKQSLFKRSAEKLVHRAKVKLLANGKH